jgi:acyl-coenzyme A thioesterase PaaI-like protein
MTAQRGGGGSIVRSWQALAPKPGGRWLFNRLLRRRIPYTGTIHPDVRVLEKGHARVRMADRRGVRNHLRSVHAIALTNLGELTTGLALTAALPAGVRAIPTRLTTEYLKKARGVLEAECRIDVPEINDRLDLDVTVEVKDPAGDVVSVTTVRWHLRSGP